MRCSISLAQRVVVLRRLGRAAERGEDRPDVVHRAEVAVDRRGPVLGRLQHPDQVLLGLGGLPHVLAQPVDVELDAGDLLQRRDHLLLELLDDVVAHALRHLALALVGHVQHHGFAVVLLAHQLEPLHEGEAAGVGEQQHVGRGQRLAGRADVALQHHAEVGLDVGADVLGVAVALGVHDHLAGLLAHAVLQRVGLGQAAREVEAHQQLVQVAGHEGRRHLRASCVRGRELVVVAVDHLLLQPHRVLFLHRRDGFFRRGGGRHHLYRCAHAALQSLIESAKVPACSRIGAIWPVFSAYLNAV